MVLGLSKTTRHYKYITKGIILLLLISGCAPISPDASLIPTAQKMLIAPSTVPDFITVLDPAPAAQINYQDTICVIINYGPLWELGDSGDELANSLKERLRFSIDGQILNNSDISHFGPERGKFDAQGNQLGTHGFSRACYKANLAKGIHLATVEVRSTSGKLHTYSWSFTLN